MKTFFCAILTIFVSSIPAFAVTVNTPSNNATVNPQFPLAASSATCAYQPVTQMGYSIDSGTDITVVPNQVLQATVNSGTGEHTLHVKAWNASGATCVVDVAVTVGSGDGGNPTVPSNAISVSNIQAFSSWRTQHDTGTNGDSNGQTGLVGSPSHTGTTRAFGFNYKNRGGERFATSFADDTTSRNFLYDAWVYIPGSASGIANLELDLNQTMPNGETVIFGFQCDGYSGTWDYTQNLGTAEHPNGNWANTSVACDVRNWSTNTWHHVQIAYARDDAGMVTYQSVSLDGVQSNINVTTFAARRLGWGKALSTNFQMDGRGAAGSATLYLDDLTIYRW